MRYKLFGKSGLRVSELCLGAMTFGQDWGSMLAGAPKDSATSNISSAVQSLGLRQHSLQTLTYSWKSKLEYHFRQTFR